MLSLVNYGIINLNTIIDLFLYNLFIRLVYTVSAKLIALLFKNIVKS